MDGTSGKRRQLQLRLPMEDAADAPRQSGSETRRRRLLLPIRCTAAEIEQFKSAAAKAGFRTVAEFIRVRCLGPGRGRANAQASRLDRAELVRVLGHLGKYGSNLNQIAKAANSGGDPLRDDQLYELQAQVREIAALVRKALGRGR